MAGSIIKRGEHTYRLQVYMGSDLTGKELRYTKTIHVLNKKEAEKELAKFYLECEQKKALKITKCSVSEFMKTWWNQYVKLYTKKSTWRGYKTAIDCHINPKLGDIPISKLTLMQIQQWVNSLVEQGLSPKTIKNYYSVLANAMHYAVVWDYILKNPCDNVVIPKQRKSEAKYYTINEVKCLCKALESISDDFLDYKAGIYLALFGGLRKGEILGLNEEDVIFEENKIRIVRNRMIAPGEGVYEDTPKTDSSIRTINLPPEVIDILKNLLEKQNARKKLLGTKWRNSKALLKGREGGPLYPQNLQRWFSKFLEENELPHLGLHGLRHTHTSMLVSMAAGDISQISKRLGHSESSITLNTYTHLFENNDQDIAENLSQNFFNKQK